MCIYSSKQTRMNKLTYQLTGNIEGHTSELMSLIKPKQELQWRLWVWSDLFGQVSAGDVYLSKLRHPGARRRSEYVMV